MPVMLMVVNYVVTLFIGLAALSGAAPWWIVGVLPIAVFLQYRFYRANEPADETPAHAVGAST